MQQHIRTYPTLDTVIRPPSNRPPCSLLSAAEQTTVAMFREPGLQFRVSSVLEPTICTSQRQMVHLEYTPSSRVYGIWAYHFCETGNVVQSVRSLVFPPKQSKNVQHAAIGSLCCRARAAIDINQLPLMRILTVNVHTHASQSPSLVLVAHR